MIKCSLCYVQQEWWGLHWGLRQGWAGGLWGLRFCWFVEISRGGGSTLQPHRTEPCQCVSGQSWACHGAPNGQMQPLQCSEVVMGPELGAAPVPGIWVFGGVFFYASLWRFSEEEAAFRAPLDSYGTRATSPRVFRPGLTLGPAAAWMDTTWRASAAPRC